MRCSVFLLVLDKNPYKAAELIPDRLKFKQLLELGQLICSAGISDVYKPIKQGKELQEWVKNNRLWVYRFMTCLWIKVVVKTNIKLKTMVDFYKIRQNLFESIKNKKRISYPKVAIFRYVKEYAEMTNYESNSELPIDVAIIEYKRYLEYKEKEYNKKKQIKKKDVKNDTKRN